MLEWHSVQEVSAPQFVKALTHFSRQLPEVYEADLLKAGPSFFKHQDLTYKTVERGVNAMFARAVSDFLSSDVRDLFKTKIAGLNDRKVLEYDPPVKNLVEQLARSKQVKPHDAPLLLDAAVNYLGAKRAIGYLRELGNLGPEEFHERFAVPESARASKFSLKYWKGLFERTRVKLNRTEAGRHFERFARIFGNSKNHEVFQYEVRRHDRELPRINALELPGVDHHLVITDKPAFYGIYPSIYGGDNFHVEHVKLSNGESRVLIIKTDIGGHGEEDHSLVNHVRNHVFGIDETEARNANGNPLLETEEGTRKFLRAHMGHKDQVFNDNEIIGTCVAEVFNPHSGKSISILAGEQAPLLAHPKEGLIEYPANINPKLGTPKDPDFEYETTEHDMPKDGVKLMASDVFDNKDQKLFPKDDVVGYPNTLVNHFVQGVKHGLSATGLAHSAYRLLLRALKGRYPDDDGRIFAWRYAGKVKGIRVPASERAKAA